MRKAYGTPLIEDRRGEGRSRERRRDGALRYNPATGQELWRVETIGTDSTSCRPVAGPAWYTPPQFSSIFWLFALMEKAMSRKSCRLEPKGGSQKPSVLIGRLLHGR